VSLTGNNCAIRTDARRPACYHARVAVWAVLVIVLTSPASGQTIKNRPTTAATRSAATGVQKQATSTSSDAVSATRVVLALGAVVSLILFFKWGARRFMIGGVASGQSRAIQIISRTIVSPKQQLMLVKVGRRLVLVANTGAGMNSICEIRDEQEVAELLGQVSAEQGDSVSKAFGSLFRREEEKFTPPGAEDSDEGIRSEPTTTDSPEAAEVSATRDELSGLMEKVRLVSRQFKRS
jgi:flagellar biogenesis protein FliO